MTKIDLADGKETVDIPDTIRGYSVVTVVKSEQPKVSAHTCKVVGTATCTKKAICGLCGNEYIKSDNHNLVHIPAKIATDIESGNIEYWRCLDCCKSFADENGTKGIKLADTVIAVNAWEKQYYVSRPPLPRHP